MNAAARMVNQGILTRSFFASLFLTRTQLMTMTLVFSLLTSALGIVYTTHESRDLRDAMQQNLMERDRIHVEWGQLLLERGAWIMQARVQKIAQEKLDMAMPAHKAVVIIHE